MQKKNLIRNKQLIFFLFFTFLILAPVTAKSGEGHSWDMLAVIGLYSENDLSKSGVNYQKLYSLFSSINDYIDKYNQDGFYDILKQNFPYFSWGKYGHRLINHWGFDLDLDLDSEGAPTINQYPNSLSITFEEKFRNWYGDDANFLVSDWYRFLKYIRDAQEKRNQKIIDAVKINLGLNTSASRDVAALLYYTHLLGDHIEHEGAITGESVLELEKIIKNIDLHVKSLSKKCSWFYNDYKKSVKSIPKLDDSSYAEQVLSYIEIYVPKILKFQYSTQFTNKGLNFCFEEELLKV